MGNLIIIIIIIFTFCCFFNEKIIDFNTKQQTDTTTYEHLPANKKSENYKIKNQNQEHFTFKEEIQNNRNAINSLFPANYIDRTLENGYLIHWNPNTFPLKIYIENNPQLPDYFYENVKLAFEEWQNKTENFITFLFVDDPKVADIKCTFPDDFNKEIKKDNTTYIAGYTKLNYDNSRLQNASITLATTDTNNKYITRRSVYLTAIHEIGHSLGIMGHSENKKDIMFPIKTANEISIGDINTIKLLYSIVPDISNKPYTAEQTEKYITSEDIMGEYKKRIDIELENITDDLNIDGSAFSGKYFDKANLYSKKQDYNSAIKYYKKGLETAENNNTKSNVYKKIAYCYSKLNDFDSAIYYTKTAQYLKPDDNNIVNMASYYYQKGNTPQAKNMIINLIEKNPENFHSYKLLGRIYYEEKNWTKLEELYQKSKTNFPDNPPLTKK